ncbi:MAG: Lrp/AsnC ligand binding domain-containing protein [Candidatus Thorarchaeota archaeon]
MTLKIFLTVNTAPVSVNDICDSLKQFKEVKEIFKIKAGDFEIIAVVEIQNLELYRLFVERVAQISNITDFESFITVGST